MLKTVFYSIVLFYIKGYLESFDSVLRVVTPKALLQEHPNILRSGLPSYLKSLQSLKGTDCFSIGTGASIYSSPSSPTLSSSSLLLVSMIASFKRLQLRA
jgi:hypothetical protein